MLDGDGFKSPTRGGSIFFERWMLWASCVMLLCSVALACLVFLSISYNQQYRLACRILRTWMPNQLYEESTNINCNWYLDWRLPSQDCPRMVRVREKWLVSGDKDPRVTWDIIGGERTLIVKHKYWSEYWNSENLYIQQLCVYIYMWCFTLPCACTTHTPIMVTIHLQSSIPIHGYLLSWKEK